MVDIVKMMESSSILMSPILNSLKILNTLNVLKIRKTPPPFLEAPSSPYWIIS